MNKHICLKCKKSIDDHGIPHCNAICEYCRDKGKMQPYEIGDGKMCICICGRGKVE